MATPTTRRRSQPRRRAALTARLSLLALLAALLPLGVVVGINAYVARGALVEQGRTALTTDGRAKVNVISLYMNERTLDGEALASLPTVAPYLLCTELPGLPDAQATALNKVLHCDTSQQLYQDSSCRALLVGIHRDTNYALWSLYDGRGDQTLSSANATCRPVSGAAVPQEDLKPVMGLGKQAISGVYYDQKSNHAYVQIYTPIVLEGSKQPVGFMRATLWLDYIWGVVNNEKNADGSGSYAFLTDENGVRIADSKPTELFTAVAPLTASTAQLIASEQRFGSGAAVPVQNLPEVATALNSTSSEGSFQGLAVPGGAQYQYVRERVAGLPWTYFVLSPLTTVTLVADNQVRFTLVSAAVVALLAALIGSLVGRQLAQPVQGATGNLVGAAAALKQLAARQENSASEQQWVVDACRTGLDSVRYLSEAMNQAAKRIMDASNWFGEYWDRLNEEQARRTVQHLADLARYVDEAARRQQTSSERMGKAINVTMQVSDQLVAGASAAMASASQLEDVVSNLQRVVGGRPPAQLDEADAEPASAKVANNPDAQFAGVKMNGQMGAMAQMAPAPVAAPVRGARSGRLAMQQAQQGQQPTYASGQPMQPMQSMGGIGQMQSMGGAMAQGREHAPRAPRAPWNADQPSQVFDGYDNFGGFSGGGAQTPMGPMSGPQGQWGNGMSNPNRQGW